MRSSVNSTIFSSAAGTFMIRQTHDYNLTLSDCFGVALLKMVNSTKLLEATLFGTFINCFVPKAAENSK